MYVAGLERMTTESAVSALSYRATKVSKTFVNDKKVVYDNINSANTGFLMNSPAGNLNRQIIPK